PVGNADIHGFNAFQQQTEVSSHELAEAVTDPDTRTGWRDYSVREGEIGDLAVGYFGLLHGYVVQAEYSNYYKGPVIPYDATPYYAGGSFAAAPTAGQMQRLNHVDPMQVLDIETGSREKDFPSAANAVMRRTPAEIARDEFFAVLGAVPPAAGAP